MINTVKIYLLFCQFEIYIDDANWERAQNAPPADARRKLLCRDLLGQPDASQAGLVLCDGSPANATQSNPPARIGPKEVTLDLGVFEGQEITLYLANFNRVDGWYNTWTYVSEVMFDGSTQ